MTAWFIGLICLALTVLAFYKNNPILSIVTGLCWFGLLAFTRTTPFPTIAIGSTVDNILMGVYGGMAMAVWLSQLRYSVKNSNAKKTPDKYELESDENGLMHGTRSNGYV